MLTPREIVFRLKGAGDLTPDGAVEVPAAVVVVVAGVVGEAPVCVVVPLSDTVKRPPPNTPPDGSHT